MSANYDLTSGLDEGFEFKATLKGKLPITKRLTTYSNGLFKNSRN